LILAVSIEVLIHPARYERHVLICAGQTTQHTTIFEGFEGQSPPFRRSPIAAFLGSEIAMPR
jgi:hypothetical protein